MDNLANAMVNIKNNENASKTKCTLKPASKLLGNILKIMQKNGYIGNFEFIEDGKAGLYEVNLQGNINNCKAIKPRFSVKHDEFETFEERYLPAKDFGLLIASTPKGLMTQIDAKKQKIGGKLLAFVY